MIRVRVELDVERVLAPYFEGLAHEDPRIRMRAADALLDRAYGRPRRLEEPEARAERMDLSLLTDRELDLYEELIDKVTVLASPELD